MTNELKDRISDELRHMLSRRLGAGFDEAREIVLTIDGHRIIVKAR